MGRVRFTHESPNLGYAPPRARRWFVRIRPIPIDCGLRKELRQCSSGLAPASTETAEQGFTLIELLVVIIILGILLAIAVPSYLGFRDRAANNAAKANLRAALPSAEAYYSDNDTYSGMDTAALVGDRLGRLADPDGRLAATSTYCLTDSVSGKTWSVAGPARRARTSAPARTARTTPSISNERGAGDRAPSRLSPPDVLLEPNAAAASSTRPRGRPGNTLVKLP